jgi:hypothetical protein
MSWEDELYAEDEPMRETGLDWLQTTSPAIESRVDRRMKRAARKIRKAEKRYLKGLQHGG